MENSLPEGWVSVSPLELAEKIRGVSYGREDVIGGTSKGYLPVLRANGIDDNKIVYKDLVYVKSSQISTNQFLRDGDVLIAMSSGSKNLVGKTAQFFGENKISFGAFCGVLRPNAALNPRYFGYFFQSKNYRDTISDSAAGTNINNLKNEHFESLRIPIAPLAEQHRIVAKLDELMEKIDRCRARLERIPKILKRFRQSILSAAVSGKLVKSQSEWREVNLHSLVRKGDIFDGPFGSNLKSSDYVDKGVRVVRLENIEHLYFVGEKETFISKLKYQTLLRHTVGEGDIIFSSFITEEIRACILPKLQTKAVAKADCFCIRPDEKLINKQFLLFSLVSSNSYNQLVLNIHGATRPRINTTQLKELTLSVPGLDDQNEIVCRVEQLFALAGKIEARYTKAKAQIDKLPQSLLTKAFRGELVAQDPNDEAAGELLNRIQSQKGSR